MGKIFRYELTRLLLDKFFLTFCGLACVYGYRVLSADIILGVAYTAPFSGWSFGSYLARLLPLLLVALLLFVAALYSHQEKQTRQLTRATPVNPLRYALVKCGALVTGYFALSLLVVAVGLMFYGVIFRVHDYSAFLLPALVTLLPGLLFVLGAGLLVGRLHANLLYVLMLIVLILGFAPLPPFADLYGGHLFATYPLSLPVDLDGEPAFTLPAAFLLGRLFYSAAGAAMVFYGVKRYAKT